MEQRDRARPLIEFIGNIARHRIERDRLVALINPWASDAWQEECLEDGLLDPCLEFLYDLKVPPSDLVAGHLSTGHPSASASGLPSSEHDCVPSGEGSASDHRLCEHVRKGEATGQGSEDGDGHAVGASASASSGLRAASRLRGV